jgi:hypothetical protein
MKKLLGLLLVVASSPLLAQVTDETVPVGLVAIPIIAVGAIGYGIYKIAKKK